MSQPGDVRCGSRFESIPRAARTCGALLLLVLLAAWPGWQLQAAEIMDRYYAYPAVHDAEGVIAPWYTAQNGQLDFRIRVAAETLKRYPWTTRDEAIDLLLHALYRLGLMPLLPLEWWLLVLAVQQSFILLRLGSRLARLAGASALLRHAEGEPVGPLPVAETAVPG